MRETRLGAGIEMVRPGEPEGPEMSARTKSALIEEIAVLRARLAELEATTGTSPSARTGSDRERIEHALKASELRYRRLFETAKDGILILDAGTGTISDVNPFLLNLLGYSRAELIGRTLWEIGSFRDV